MQNDMSQVKPQTVLHSEGYLQILIKRLLRIFLNNLSVLLSTVSLMFVHCNSGYNDMQRDSLSSQS